jgi:hypothetical protein
MPASKVSADAAHVPNLAVVLASENEWFGVPAQTISPDKTKFALIDHPVG